MTKTNPKDSAQILAMAQDRSLQAIANEFITRSARYRYSYNFTWLGIPIIQYPQDVVAIQELIWQVKPDIIVETGVAHGGSLILSASMLQLLGGDGFVIGIDVDIREHNRRRLEQHPLAPRLRLIEGSSTSGDVVAQVRQLVEGQPKAGPRKVMVFLDSNHTHDHVLAELEAYAPLVPVGSYLIVEDTNVNGHPAAPDFGPGPMEALWDFMATDPGFEVDARCERYFLTQNPSGYLTRVR